MIRTRFAPSPTGLLHIGNLRSALYAYALAKHSGGKFILRIEDTDQKRLVIEGYEDIKNILTTFDLKWDEYYVQSERKSTGIYQASAEKLIASGHAFYCQCPAKNAKTEGFSQILRDPCRDLKLTSGAVKLRVPDNERISYTDFVLQKEVSWDSNTVYDATLLKSDGFPTYHLAAMTDDLEMRITHILRGHDWMPSTPIHLLVFRYLGDIPPEIGHLTDILSPKGGKLSKRRDSVFCETFLKEGYLPEALLNFIMLLGWAPKDNRELFTLENFVSDFDPKGFQKANPLFSFNKLDWLNGHYIRSKTNTDLTQLVKPFMKSVIPDTILTQILPLIKERLVKLSEIDILITPFLEKPKLGVLLFSDPTSDIQYLTSGIQHLKSISDWSKLGIETGWTDKIKANGWKVGDFFMSLRIAIFGSKQTPPVTDSMLVLGKEETLDRINSAIDILK